MKIHNPVIWADVPDNDVIRVGNAFYMVSTSMHSMPGCPIMRSYDLQNWEIISYIFDRLEDNDGHNLVNGSHVYGQGSWAASLRYVDGRFYCLFNCNDTHHAYVFTTDDCTKSNWERHELPMYMHDPSFLIDDDGRRYVIYGNGDIRIVELTEDMLSIKEGGLDAVLFRDETPDLMLRCEGGHAYKIGGYYYAIYIEWPKVGNRRRREVCYRWKSLASLPMQFVNNCDADANRVADDPAAAVGTGLIERKIILDDDMSYHNAGVAQGAIFDMPDSKHWAAVLFQDHGAVGRIPYVLPLEWKEAWPMPGVEGKVPEDFELEGFVQNADIDMTSFDYAGDLTKSNFIGSDEFDSDQLDYKWQWNHNPDEKCWSLTEHEGYLRLKNEHLTDRVLQARNTLTQRTFGPTCVISTYLDISGLKDGDRAGIVAVQGNFATVGVINEAGTAYVAMCDRASENYSEKIVEKIKLDTNAVYLRVRFNFLDNRDEAEFEWSIDGSNWAKIGDTLKMQYTLDHFMGYRAGLFSYPTKEIGGYADFDYYHVNA